MQKKIIISTMLSVIVILLSLGIISNLSIHDSIKHSLSKRSELAGLLAKYTDSLLQGNLTRLYDISLSGAIDLNDGDWRPEAGALKTAYQYSIFTDGIFLLDLNGDIVYTYPFGQMKKRNLMKIPYVHRTLEERKAVVSNIYTEEPTKRKVIYVLVPLRGREGEVIGAVGGEINPTNYILTNVIKSIAPGTDTVIELVDSYGVVIASNNPVRVFACSDRNKVLGNLIASKKKAVMECHRCHGEAGEQGDVDFRRTTDMLAFAPLSEAPWGVTVREPQKEVFAPSSGLKKKFVILGFISAGTALLLAMGMSKSIVNPIKSLIRATNRIAEGNLKDPVRAVSRDEIGTLSESFEIMRQRLSDSNEKFQKYNAQLEMRVIERTRELQQSRKRLAVLLHEVIRAQEDERKRIARELHDETSQSIAALGMSIEIAAISYKGKELSSEHIAELSGRVTQLLEGISRIIQDLRPPVLDDLGLESAVRWLLENHLAEKGIRYELNCSDEFHNLITDSETILNEKTVLMLFRVIQEAIINIYKHSRATVVKVALSYEDQSVKVGIEDDGVGFDVQEVLRDAEVGVSGYGILGLKERVSLLEGVLDIFSEPGKGTSIEIEIPFRALELRDV
ncbi:MAG: HAMP domain-containing protein [Candidatus Sulfobium sp.]|jgi:signal transduction histidine kinase